MRIDRLFFMYRCHLVENMRKKFKSSDFAAPLQFDAETFDDESPSESESELTLPTNTKRAPGRPRKRHIRTRAEGSEDASAKRTRVQKCGRCRESGHSVRMCNGKI